MKRFFILGPLLVASILLVVHLSRPKAGSRSAPITHDATASSNPEAAQNTLLDVESLRPPPNQVSRTGPASHREERAKAGLSDIPPAFLEFARWFEQFTNGTSNVIEGERRAWKRREVMADLIQTDPARALALSLPFAWRSILPHPVARLLEAQIDGRGDYKVAVATEFQIGQSTTMRTVELGTNKYQAFVYGRRLIQSCQNSIPLHGIALDGKMAVQAEPLRVLSAQEAVALIKWRGRALDAICGVSGQSAKSRQHPVYAEAGGSVLCFCGTDHYELVNRQWALAESGTGGFGSSGVAGVGGSPSDEWTHGPKSVLYMRVNFPDDLSEPISEESAYAAMEDVNAFYVDTSYDLTSLDATVAPLVTLLQPKSWYATAGPGQLLSDARELTRQAGYDTANYERDIVAFTSVPGYDFGGLAYVGGKGVWLQSMGAGVTAHELGHNYGLLHANFWDTTTNASMIGPGTNLEYGNINDTMGAAGAGAFQFNAAHKNKLDWLNADAVHVVSTNAVYRIYPFDVPDWQRVSGRFYAAAVQKDFMRYYWLEFRQLFTDNPWQQNGILLNWSPWARSSGGTQLIDSTPGSPTVSGDSREDAAVVVGRTFNDNPAGVHITPIARGATGTDPWLDVQVNIGTFPGNQAPELTLEVDQTNVAPGALVHFHAASWDPEGDAMAYSWTFDDLSFSTNNQPWFSKAFSSAGDHVVRCVVSDMKGGQASANAIVTVGSPNGFRVIGHVTDTNGVPLEGVLVSNGENKLSQFVGGWTDSHGQYVICNVAGDLTLNAVQFGYALTAATNWSNPLNISADTNEVDFIAVPLTAVNLMVDTNVVAKSDVSTHYFTLTRFGDTNNDLSVQLNLSGTATSGTDFTLTPDQTTNSVTIPAGTNSISFAFQAVNNSRVTGPLTATLTIIDDINFPSPAYALAPPAEATITIQASDTGVTPNVTVSTPTPEVTENGADLGQFIFSRKGSLQGDLVVKYSIGGTARPGVDYTPLTGVALIPDGLDSVTMSLQPRSDTTVGSNVTVVVNVLPDSTYAVGNRSSASVTILEDDFTSVTIYPTANATKPSTAGSFTVQRDGDLTGNLVVYYTVGGTAIPTSDYTPLPNSVFIPAGQASAELTVFPLHTGTPKGDVSVRVSLTNQFNYHVGTPGSATVLIHDDYLPSVSISAPVNSISEQGDTAGQFRVSRTGSTAGGLTVYLAVSGNATPGADYLPIANSVVIPDGADSVNIDVIAFHDLIQELTEEVELTVQANSNYNLGPEVTARVEITDDQTSQVPGVGFCASASSVLESQSPGIAVGLSMTSQVPVTVDYKVIGGTAPSSRYSLPAGTLTIKAGDYVAFIPLQVIDDQIVEPPQTVQVVIFNPSNATLDAIKVHTYTILDDDANSVSVSATAANATEGGAQGNFRIARAGPTSSNQVVDFQITGTASAPTDYAPLGTSVTIPVGATFVDLPVIPVQNRTVDQTQTVVLTLTTAPGGNIVSPNQATVTIGDNNTNPLPIVSVTSTNQPFAVEGGANGSFVFTRNGPATNSLTINFTTAGTAKSGIRYQTLPSFVTIPAGQTSVSLPVIAVDDKLIEGEETVILWLTDNQTYRMAYPASATVTIQDNEQQVWIDASDFYSSKYGPDLGQFTFSRTGTTNTPVTVRFTISGTAINGYDYVGISNSITIPAGSLTATLPIIPLHTGKVEGPVTLTLTLQSDPTFELGTPTSATVIIDDDMPMVRLFGIVTNVLEGSGTNGVFRLVRTGNPQFDFTAHIAVGGTATYKVDYPAFPTNIYFTCGVTSIDLFISPTNELVIEPDETVSAALLPDPAYTILSPSSAELNIADAGNNQTPLVTITSPVGGIAFLVSTNIGLVLNATVQDDQPSNTLSWVVLSGPAGYSFSSTNTADTTIFFTNAGVYTLRLTADDGQLQGFADVRAVVAADLLTSTNVLHWSFDEGSGTNVTDSSGAGRDGQFVGAPIWITNGILGDALRFSGTDDYVRPVTNTSFLDGLRAFTLSMWVRPVTNNSQEGFFSANDSGTNETLSFGTQGFASCGNYTNVFEINVPTTRGVAHRVSANGAVQPTAWQQVAVVWSNGLAPALYINGQVDQPAAGFAPLAGVLTNCPDFMVGKGPLSLLSSWTGNIDDVRVYARALDQEELLALGAYPLTNHAPVVDAGTNVTVQTGVPVTLVGTVTDDGLPTPPGQVTTTWTYLGTNTFAIPDPSNLTNTLLFTDPGDYVFQLTADDGQAATFALVTITVILPTEVDVYASIADAYELGPVNGQFILTRAGDTNDLTVYLSFTGTATNAVDYAELPSQVTFPAGTDTLTYDVAPFLDYEIEGDEFAILNILTNAAYFVGSGQATVTIHDSPYGVWSITNFTLQELTHPEISGAHADFNHDGVVNFADYALNRDPKTTNSVPPFQWDFETDAKDGLQHLTITYTRRLPPRDVQYGVFVSADLLSWNTGTNAVEEFSTSPDPNGFTETVKTRALLPFPSQTNLFMNLRVWLEQVPN